MFVNLRNDVSIWAYMGGYTPTHISETSRSRNNEAMSSETWDYFAIPNLNETFLELLFILTVKFLRLIWVLI